MYIVTIVKNPKPLTKTLGCDSPHNPKKCLKKCINDSNIIIYSQILANLRTKPSVAPKPNAIPATCKLPMYIPTAANMYVANLTTPYSEKLPLASTNSVFDISYPLFIL